MCMLHSIEYPQLLNICVQRFFLSNFYITFSIICRIHSKTQLLCQIHEFLFLKSIIELLLNFLTQVHSAHHLFMCFMFALAFILPVFFFFLYFSFYFCINLFLSSLVAKIPP
jgi:hypothetical protein